MPVYEYQCQSCHHPTYVACVPSAGMKARYDAGHEPCRRGAEACGGALHRVFSFSIGPSFQAHYNMSQGQWVPTRAELHDNAKRASDAATARTGVPHEFRVHDVGGSAKEDFGVGEEGMGATYDARRGKK